MSKAARKPKTPRPARGWSAVRPLVIVLITLVVTFFLLLGLRELGQLAGLNLGERERYEVRFADIECPAPPGMSREGFLDDVRRASDLPETFQIMEPGLLTRLQKVFESSPWVKEVEYVATTPPATVFVGLRFRVPLLAVTTAANEILLVDAHAVLIPRSPKPVGIAYLANVIDSPPPRDGDAWLDPVVKRAVELVSVYRPSRIERTKTGWKLATQDGKELLVEK